MNTLPARAQKLMRPDGTAPRVLVVDDEHNLTELLSMALRYEGWEVKSAGTGMAAVRAAREFEPDAVALDMMLPDMDGMEVLRRMREHNQRIPVLFLTARDAVEDRIAGLDTGADDYLTKPFDFGELLARLRALARRGPAEHDPVLRVGDLELDPAARSVKRAGTGIPLSTKEFQLLEVFMRHPGEVLSRYQLLEGAWDTEYEHRSNVIDVYVRYLREKVDRPFGVTTLETVRGAGYRLRTG